MKNTLRKFKKEERQIGIKGKNMGKKEKKHQKWPHSGNSQSVA